MLALGSGRIFNELPRFMFFSKRLLLTLLLLTLITPSNLIFYRLAEGAPPAQPSADRQVGLWVDHGSVPPPRTIQMIWLVFIPSKTSLWRGKSITAQRTPLDRLKTGTGNL